MRVRSTIIAIGIGLFLLSGLTQDASAQQRERSGRSTKFSVNAVQALQFDANLSGDAAFKVSRAVVSAELTMPASQSSDIGLSLLYDHEDFSFTGITQFAGPAPWNEVHRYSAGLSYSHRLGQGWRIFISPSLGYARESGADGSRALIYGSVISAGRRINQDLTIGMGAGVFYRLEETRIFPYLMVRWNLSERWRLTNPLRAGPTGPAGLELTYTAGSVWELGFGGAYRSIRFRLDDQGFAPQGIGEISGAPVWVRLGRSLGTDVSANLYGGAVFGGRLAIENEQGRRLGAEAFGPAVFAALTITASY